MSPMPTMNDIGQELYDQLEAYSYDDADYDYLLAHYCNAIGLMLDDIAGWVRDTDNDELGWSVLIDLDRCPEDQLGYLAQFIGVSLKPGLADAEQRLWIEGADGFNRGTPEAIRVAVENTLTGLKRIFFDERVDPATWPADEAYHLTITTVISETPDPALTEAEIVKRKPAGIVLHYQTITGQTYISLETGSPTYADVLADYADYDAVLAG